jgi:hypothetical protein
MGIRASRSGSDSPGSKLLSVPAFVLRTAGFIRRPADYGSLARKRSGQGEQRLMLLLHQPDEDRAQQRKHIRLQERDEQLQHHDREH